MVVTPELERVGIVRKLRFPLNRRNEVDIIFALLVEDDLAWNVRASLGERHAGKREAFVVRWNEEISHPVFPHISLMETYREPEHVVEERRVRRAHARVEVDPTQSRGEFTRKRKALAKWLSDNNIKPGHCICGCGGATKSKFCPGHDARFKGMLKRNEVDDAREVATDLGWHHLIKWEKK